MVPPGDFSKNFFRVRAPRNESRGPATPVGVNGSLATAIFRPARCVRHWRVLAVMQRGACRAVSELLEMWTAVARVHERRNSCYLAFA